MTRIPLPSCPWYLITPTKYCLFMFELGGRRGLVLTRKKCGLGRVGSNRTQPAQKILVAGYVQFLTNFFEKKSNFLYYFQKFCINFIFFPIKFHFIIFFAISSIKKTSQFFWPAGYNPQPTRTRFSLIKKFGPRRPGTPSLNVFLRITSLFDLHVLCVSVWISLSFLYFLLPVGT